MQYFVYHIEGERRLIQGDKFDDYMRNEEWFKTPSEAKAAWHAAKDVKPKVEKKKAVKKTVVKEG